MHQHGRMPRFVGSFAVSAPIDVVARFLADPTHRPDWDVTVATITPDAQDPTAWDQLVAFYGKRIPFRLVRHRTEPTDIEFRGTNSSAVLTERFSLEVCDAGTTVTYEAEVRLTGALRVFNKGLDSAFAALKAKSVARLTRALDARPQTPTLQTH